MAHFKLITFCIIFVFSSQIQASEKNILLRIDRLERMMQNNSQTKVLTKLKQLQHENQELRSQIEELSYRNDKLKSRLYSLNEDMDRRILILESEVVDSGTGTVPPEDATTKQVIEAESLVNSNNSYNNNDTNHDNIENLNQNSDEEQQFVEQKAYQAAFNELKAQRYGKASKSLALFLIQYPDSSYSHLAQYWLAESSYAQRDFKKSIKEYTALLNNHPDSQKRSEATLKIAYCHYELGNKKVAKNKLQELIKEYPKSTEAGQAKQLLKKLK